MKRSGRTSKSPCPDSKWTSGHFLFRKEIISHILPCKARAGRLCLRGHGNLRAHGLARPEPSLWGARGMAGELLALRQPPAGPAAPFPALLLLSLPGSGFRLSLRASLPGAERGGSGRCREWRAAAGNGGALAAFPVPSSPQRPPRAEAAGRERGWGRPGASGRPRLLKFVSKCSCV